MLSLNSSYCCYFRNNGQLVHSSTFNLLRSALILSERCERGSRAFPVCVLPFPCLWITCYVLYLFMFFILLTVPLGMLSAYKSSMLSPYRFDVIDLPYLFIFSSPPLLLLNFCFQQLLRICVLCELLSHQHKSFFSSQCYPMFFDRHPTKWSLTIHPHDRSCTVQSVYDYMWIELSMCAWKRKTIIIIMKHGR